MSVSGYKYSFTVGGVETSYQNIEFEHTAPGIPASSRLYRDGTVNQGTTSREIDLREGVIRINSLLKSPGRPPNLDLGPQVVYWFIKYDGITIANGNRIYVEQNHFTGSIPGAAMHRFLAYTDENFTAKAA